MKKILMLVAASALSAFATTTCSGPGLNGSFTLTDLTFTTGENIIDNTHSCNVNGSIFSNFQVNAASGFNGIAFSLTITPASNGNGIEVDHTNLFGTGADAQFFFQISPGISNITLSVGPGETVTEIICAVSTINTNGACPQGSRLNTLSLGATDGGSSSSPVNGAGTDYVFKDFSGGSEFSQIVVPEPMSLSLMGIGLLGLGMLGRKFRK